MIKDKHFLVVWIATLALLLGLSLFAAAGLAQDGDEPPAESPPASEAETSAPVDPLTFTATSAPTRAYLPLLACTELKTTLPFVETFDAGWPAQWNVFTNYPGLEEDDWVWYGESPSWGFLSYEPASWKGFALLMYLGSGSAEWTDYQIVSTIRNRADKLAGLWFRGQYVERSDGGGGWVGGYYLHIKPKDNTVYLWRIRPETHHFAQADVVASRTLSSGIARGWNHVKIQVRGANIKVWLKQQEEPESAYRQVIDWTDPYSAYIKGTVGFSTYGGLAVFNDIAVTPLSALGQ